MPPRSRLPGDLPRNKFLKALRRLGFLIDISGGDGSHCKVVRPETQKSVTIPLNLRKDVLYYVLNELEEKCGLTWERIKDEI